MKSFSKGAALKFPPPLDSSAPVPINNDCSLSTCYPSSSSNYTNTWNTWNRIHIRELYLGHCNWTMQNIIKRFQLCKTCTAIIHTFPWQCWEMGVLGHRQSNVDIMKCLLIWCIILASLCSIYIYIKILGDLKIRFFSESSSQNIEDTLRLPENFIKVR